MHDRILDLTEALIYALMLVSGGLGGAAIASRRVLRHKSVSCMMVVAYVIIGAASGSMVWAAAIIFGLDQHLDTLALLGFSTLTGGAFAVVLGATQGGITLIAEKLGWHFEFTVKRDDRPSDKREREGQNQ